MKQGRPKKIDNIDPIKQLSFKDFDEIISTYIRLLKEGLKDETLPDKERLYYKATLELPRYLLNILILKAEFRYTKKVTQILHMEDAPRLVSSALLEAKKFIKNYVKLHNNITNN